MSAPDLSDYVDVAERIRAFHERYPEGSLQSEVELTTGVGVLCKAYAYRTPDDPRPGVGHAFEPIPGKTPYTRDSEVMNAETSAWGRAIVALGFVARKIASADEVRNRSGADDSKTYGASSGEGSPPAPASGSAAAAPGDPRMPFGKHKGTPVSQLPGDYRCWLAESFEAKTDVQRAIKAAAAAQSERARAITAQLDADAAALGARGAYTDEDVPF